MNDARKKKFMYLNRRAPHGTNYAQEGLEVALVGAAFEQEVCVAFVDDGVFQLKKGQDTAALGVKNFAAAFAALGDYDVKKFFVERESLEQRGLTTDDLMKIKNDSEQSLLKIVDAAALAGIIAQQDVLLNF